ncbi:Nn.00g020580.m01.CDS01 [Neocucurbitaria sp. VM-36]
MALRDQIEIRANFLQEAAHALAVSSPAASAFLGTARSKLIEDTDLEIPTKEHDAFRREFCGACGNLMIPGWSCNVSIHSESKQQGKRSKSRIKQSTKPDKSTVYACLRCHRMTAQTIQPRPSKPLRKSTSQIESRPVLDNKKSTREDDAKVVKSINASSKQRQKARKGGLQAMLAKNKSQASSQGGFDLMDFAM